MIKDIYKIFDISDNATAGEKIKHKIFIVMYPLSIFGCLINILFNIYEGTLITKLLQLIFVIIVIPVVCNFRGFAEFLKRNDWI